MKRLRVGGLKTMKIGMRLFAALLVVTNLVSLLPVYAEEVETVKEITEYIYTYSDEQIEQMQNREYDNLLHSLRSRATRDTIEVIEYYDKYETPSFCNERVAFNQPSGGTVFTTTGSGFYWSDSSTTNGSFSYSFTLGGQYFNVGLSYLPGTVTSSSGYFAAISSSQVNKAVKLYVARKYRITIYKVYKKDISTNVQTFDRYVYVKTPISQKLTVRTV